MEDYEINTVYYEIGDVDYLTIDELYSEINEIKTNEYYYELDDYYKRVDAYYYVYTDEYGEQEKIYVATWDIDGKLLLLCDEAVAADNFKVEVKEFVDYGFTFDDSIDEFCEDNDE